MTQSTDDQTNAGKLRAALERKKAGQAANGGFDSGRDGEREAAARSAAGSKPAAKRMSKRG